MGLDSKKWEQLAKLIEQEQKHWPPSLQKKLAQLGPLEPSLGQRLSKAFEEVQKNSPPTFQKTPAEIGPVTPPPWERLPKINVMSGVKEYLEREKMALDPKTWERIFERLDRRSPRIDPAIFEKLTRLVSREPIQASTNPDGAVPKDFLTFAQLAKRWGVSWGTVQNWLRAGHVPVLDRALRGKRGKKVVARKDILEFEKRNTKRLR